MVSKRILLIALLVLIAGTGFAQKSNWISGDVSILGAGLRYERMLTPNFSIGINAYYNDFFLFGGYGANAAMRLYPRRGTFFFELGLGYGVVNNVDILDGGVEIIEYNSIGTVMDEFKSPFVSTTGFIVTPGLGWKIDFGAPGGFFIQPGIRFPIAIGNQTLWTDSMFITDVSSKNYKVKEKLGIGASVVIYVSMGLGF